MQGILEGLLFISGDEGIDTKRIKNILEIDDEKLNFLINSLEEEYEVGGEVLIDNEDNDGWLATHGNPKGVFLIGA